MGDNVVTWKSIKQATISGSSAESEVQALALTETLGDFVKTLRGSMFIPTPVVMIRCDHSAAKVLATGEGSWKTKSTANKVARVKEQVELLKTVEVEFCGTKDQHADSLTKFLRGGPEQKRAQGHLSLEETEPEHEDEVEPDRSIQKYIACRAHCVQDRDTPTDADMTTSRTTFKTGFKSFSVAIFSQTSALLNRTSSSVKFCLRRAMVKFYLTERDNGTLQVCRSYRRNFRWPHKVNY